MKTFTEISLYIAGFAVTAHVMPKIVLLVGLASIPVAFIAATCFVVHLICDRR